jgi:ribosome-binding factor A
MKGEVIMDSAEKEKDRVTKEEGKERRPYRKPELSFYRDLKELTGGRPPSGDL